MESLSALPPPSEGNPPMTAPQRSCDITMIRQKQVAYDLLQVKLRIRMGESSDPVRPKYLNQSLSE